VTDSDVKRNEREELKDVVTAADHTRGGNSSSLIERWSETADVLAVVGVPLAAGAT
jgi:hypothetical protein